VLLARDPEGYRNLVKLTSIGYLEGFYHKPRIDREVLAQHSSGLIVTSACMAGEVARHLTGRPLGGGEGSGRVVREPLRRPLLPRSAGARHAGPARA
jgi:DNA polymerase III alpha subunit